MHRMSHPPIAEGRRGEGRRGTKFGRREASEGRGGASARGEGEKEASGAGKERKERRKEEGEKAEGESRGGARGGEWRGVAWRPRGGGAGARGLPGSGRRAVPCRAS